MKIVLQRVKHCQVSISGAGTGRIGKGVLVLLGIDKKDSFSEADFLAEKCASLRIFPDEHGKMDLSLIETGGAAMVVSQFTLFGDCSKGRRPSFAQAAGPEKGRELYDYFVKQLKKHVSCVETGVFGAMMDVISTNDGPVTILLDSKRLF
jgi:D-aminoacyl-tRNA deacylase